MSHQQDSTFLKNVLLSFRDIHRETRGILNNAALEKDITIVQLLLANIIKQQPGISPAAVTKEMRLGKSTISGIITRMSDAGYLNKQADPDDCRSYGLFLTSLGEKKVAETYDIYVNSLVPLLAIPTEELVQLLETHQKILAIIDEVKAND